VKKALKELNATTYATVTHENGSQAGLGIVTSVCRSVFSRTISHKATQL